MPDITQIAQEFTDAWNRRDWVRYRELLHPDYSYTGGDGKRQVGRDAGLAVAQMFASAFPDGKIDVQRIHAAGNTVVVEFIGKGTQKGELMGLAPTGRTVEILVSDILEVRDGKIVNEREYMDLLAMMQQLGAAPALSATA